MVMVLVVVGPLLALWGWGQDTPGHAPPDPPPIPQSLMTMGPQANLSLQWVQTGPDGDTVQRYTYRAYIEGQKSGVILTGLGCDGPLGQPPYPSTFHCRATPPPLVKKPGIYRVYLTVAASQDAKESLPSATAPFTVTYPAPVPPHGVVMK